MRWTYLYRAVDSRGQTIDFLLSAKREAAAAKRSFRKALGQPHNVNPHTKQHQRSSVDRASMAYPGSHKASPASLLGFTVFSGLLLVRIATHSPWRDEAQAWLITVSKSLLGLLSLPGEGHPPLWYLLLYPFTRINPELWVLKVPTILLGISTLLVLWLRSPLNSVDKALISSSFFISFQYAVVGRSYVLGTFILIFFASYFPVWRQRPAIAGCMLGLSALTHVYFGFAAYRPMCLHCEPLAHLLGTAPGSSVVCYSVCGLIHPWHCLRAGLSSTPSSRSAGFSIRPRLVGDVQKRRRRCSAHRLGVYDGLTRFDGI